jgi:soluble lytic murein transglycosylase-like protein
MTRDDRYDSLLQWYWGAQSLDWKLGKAQAMAESAMNPLAMSDKGAKGLFQFMDPTWTQYRPIRSASPFEPEMAIQAAGRYMAALRAHYQGEINKALAAYHWTHKALAEDDIPTDFALASYNWGIGHLDKYLPTVPLDGDWMAGLPSQTRIYVERINALWRGAPAPQGGTA